MGSQGILDARWHSSRHLPRITHAPFLQELQVAIKYNFSSSTKHTSPHRRVCLTKGLNSTRKLLKRTRSDPDNRNTVSVFSKFITTYQSCRMLRTFCRDELWGRKKHTVVLKPLSCSSSRKWRSCRCNPDHSSCKRDRRWWDQSRSSCQIGRARNGSIRKYLQTRSSSCIHRHCSKCGHHRPRWCSYHQSCCRCTSSASWQLSRRQQRQRQPREIWTF